MVTDSGGDRKIICTCCKSQGEKLKLMPHTNMTFINRGVNSKSSTLSDHVATDEHKWAVKEKNEDGISTDSLTSPKKVIHEVPTYSAIDSSFRKMVEKDRKGLVKLYNIAHYITVKGCAFTNFKESLALEKLHRV